MKLGLTSAAFYGRMETDESAAFLPALGLDTCEVFLETHSEYCADFGRTVRDNLAGLHCTSVHPKGTQFEPDLYAQSARQRSDAHSILCGVLDAGRELGAKWYVMHGPVSPLGRIAPDRIRNLPERFAQLQSSAAERGMEILWENVFYGAVSGAEDVRTMCALLPDVHFVLDLKQAWRAGEDPFDMLSAMGDRVRHLHILDHDTDGHICLPGEGQFDFDSLIRTLRDSGYNGSVIIEPYAQQTEDIDALRRSIAYMREVFARAGV